jgi:hypothetical protein
LAALIATKPRFYFDLIEEVADLLAKDELLTAAMDCFFAEVEM